MRQERATLNAGRDRLGGLVSAVDVDREPDPQAPARAVRGAVPYRFGGVNEPVFTLKFGLPIASKAN